MFLFYVAISPKVAGQWGVRSGRGLLASRGTDASLCLTVGFCVSDKRFQPRISPDYSISRTANLIVAPCQCKANWLAGRSNQNWLSLQHRRVRRAGRGHRFFETKRGWGIGEEDTSFFSERVSPTRVTFSQPGDRYHRQDKAEP